MPFSFKPNQTEEPKNETQTQGSVSSPQTPQTPQKQQSASSQTQQTSPTPQVSQVPQQTSSQISNSYDPRYPSEKKSLFEIAVLGMLVTSVSITVILFAYRYYLIQNVEAGKNKIASYEEGLSKMPLEEMRKLSNRMKVADTLVKNHPSVSSAFRIIEESAENKVTYNKFNISRSEKANTYDLQLDAVAANYRAIVEQTDTLKRKPFSNYVSNLKVGSIKPNDKGEITFSLSMLVSILGILPENLILKEEEPNPEVVTEKIEFSTSTPVDFSSLISTTTDKIIPVSGLNKNP